MWERHYELIRERLRLAHEARAPHAHLEAAMRWLFAAQDATDDRGVSHSYQIGQRWLRSYPETTGYIIPTLLNWSRLTGDPEGRERALEMADWELTCQLETGAIPDLVSGGPVVFDTGQVIFGWTAAYGETTNPKYLEGARRGGDWLVRALDEDGVWRHAHDSGGPGRTYNARVCWALLELAAVAGDSGYVRAARGFLDWSLEQGQGGGWYDRNCLTNDEAPLLHTIAYAARGQFESGVLLGESRYVDAARETAEQIARRVEPDGRLPGRFDRGWKARVPWACLTGMAQMCVVWHRLADHLERSESVDSTQSTRFREAACRVGLFLMRTQDLTSRRPGLRGGIRGAFPVSGGYGRWSVLNWATKFFCDALLISLDSTSIVHGG